MSKPTTQPPDFDEEFTKAVAEWRDKHRLREDDAVILLVELFRIHQQHWDALRRREIPSFEQFRADITKLFGAAQTFQQQSSALLELLRSQPPAHRIPSQLTARRPKALHIHSHPQPHPLQRAAETLTAMFIGFPAA